MLKASFGAEGSFLLGFWRSLQELWYKGPIQPGAVGSGPFTCFRS
jgi:hypothetical protein